MCGPKHVFNMCGHIYLVKKTSLQIFQPVTQGMIINTYTLGLEKIKQHYSIKCQPVLRDI